MEFIWDNVFYFWLGSGIVVTTIMNVVIPELFRSGSEFQETEWSPGMFIFFCFLGPILILLNVVFWLMSMSETAREKKEWDTLLAEQQLDLEARAKKAAETRLRKKKEVDMLLPHFYLALTKLEESSENNIETLNKQFFDEVLELGKVSIKLRRSDLKPEERKKLIGLMRFSRINFSRAVNEDSESEATLNQLTKALTAIVKKFGEKEKINNTKA